MSHLAMHLLKAKSDVFVNALLNETKICIYHTVHNNKFLTSNLSLK